MKSVSVEVDFYQLQKDLTLIREQFDDKINSLKDHLETLMQECVDCVNDENEKQIYKDQIERRLSKFKRHIENDSACYKMNLKDLTDELLKTKNELTQTQAQRDSINAAIRQGALQIQDLSTRARATMQVNKIVLKRWRSWHGHIWGWKYREGWFDGVGNALVDDDNVLQEIANQHASVNQYNEQLGQKEVEITQKQNKISDLEAELSQLETSWEVKNVEFNNETLRLEDLTKLALDALRDAQTRKMQKENDIVALNQSIIRKQAVIDHSQKTLDDLQKSLEVFTKDLRSCRATFFKSEGDRKLVSLSSQSSSNTEAVDVALSVDEEARYVQGKLKAKEALDNALREELELEKSLLDLENREEMSDETIFELGDADNELVSSNPF